MQPTAGMIGPLARLAAPERPNEKFGQIPGFANIRQTDIGPLLRPRIIGGSEENVPDRRATAEVLVEVPSLD